MKKSIYISFIFLFVFICIAIIVKTGNAGDFNNNILKSIRSYESPFLTAFTKLISNMGDWFSYTPVLIMLFIFSKTRKNYAIPAAVTLIFSALLNLILKNAFAVQRPDATEHLTNAAGYGFPSGHAMNGMVFISILLFLFLVHSENSKIIIIIPAIIFAAIFILLIGFSRMYLGVHTPTDILAGYSLGLSISIVSLKIYINKKRKITA